MKYYYFNLNLLSYTYYIFVFSNNSNLSYIIIICIHFVIQLKRVFQLLSQLYFFLTKYLLPA